MTLRWNETASDCRTARAVHPHIVKTLRLNDLGRWEYLTPPRHPRINQDLDDLIVEAVRLLPLKRFWNRTRRRVLTRHGCYQIRRDVTRFAEAVRDGRYCTCSPVECVFPKAPAVDEPGRHMPVMAPNLTDEQLDELLKSMDLLDDDGFPLNRH